MEDTLIVKPAAGDKPWSPFGWLGVAFLSFAVFFIVQTVVGLEVLFKVHPEFWRMIANAVNGMPSHANLDKASQSWVKDVTTAPYLFLYAVTGDGAMFAMAVVLGKRWLHAQPSSLGLGRLNDVRLVWLGIAAGIALILVSDVVAGFQTRVFGPHPEQVALLLLTHHGLPSFVLDMLSVAVIAPVAEEYLFRGIVFTGLAQRLPVVWAAAISGIIFGAAHLDLWSILPLSTIGMGLALLYRRTGSLWPNIIAHATVNTVALVAVYFLPQFAT